MRLVLASRSAIRHKLLADVGLLFDVDAADIDEDAIGRAVADPSARALTLARKKALATAARHPGRVVLGADQVGVLEGEAPVFLEKPRDDADHVRMLLSMAGRAHSFFPAAAIVRDDEVLAEITDAVTVRFRSFDVSVAHALAATGEGRYSCGGYESENRGGQLIESIEGSHYAVLGLPLLKVLAALRQVAPGLEGLL